MTETLGKPHVIELPTIRDARGALAVLQGSFIGFEVQRVYFLFDVDAGSERGGHAHQSLTQLFVATSGAFSVDLDNGLGEKYTFDMRDPAKALWVPPGYWRTLRSFSSGAVCLVLASAEYDEGDYIRDYDEFLEWKRLR